MKKFSAKSEAKPQTRLEAQLQKALPRLGVNAEAALVAATSGGADSTALLDALVRVGAPRRIIAAHLNHLLRGAESDADEEFVKALAARLGVPFIVERLPVAERAREQQRNLEAVARQLRYEFLQRAAEQTGAQFICTAHTQDDQAETVLLRLLRGAGATGLQGIHAQMKLSDGVKLLRPLLDVTRAEVLEHCQHYGLEFRTDSSNLSDEFTRNRVRHELLPLLRTFNPRCAEALARTAEALALEEDYWQETVAELLGGVTAELPIQPLLAAHPALRRRALRSWLSKVRGDLRRIANVHLLALESLLTPGRSGRVIELPDGWRVVREFDQLRLYRQAAENHRKRALSGCHSSSAGAPPHRSRTMNEINTMNEANDTHARARGKLKKLWQLGDLFHATTRQPHKRKFAHIDRLAGILHNGIVAPAACTDGSVCSDLNLTLTGVSVPYDSLVFLHCYNQQSFLYTLCEPGRFAVFVAPEAPVLTQQEMGRHWAVLCQDEVYVRDRVAVEHLLGLAVHPADAEAVLQEFLPEFERLALPLYHYDGTVVWPPPEAA